MSPGIPPDTPLCPDCGAPNPPGAATCGNCGRELPTLPVAVGPKPYDELIDWEHAAAVRGEGEGLRDRSGALWPVFTGIVVWACYGLMVLGLYSTHRGFSLLLGILIGPALAVTYGRALLRRLRAPTAPAGKASLIPARAPIGPLTGAEKFKTFAVTLGLTIAVVGAVLGLLVLAVCIAFYILCIRK